MTGECENCDGPSCDGFSCRDPRTYCGREHCDGRCEPRDEPDDCLNCGVCEDCIQRSIDAAEGEELIRHNAAYDEWRRLPDRERAERIRWAMDNL